MNGTLKDTQDLIRECQKGIDLLHDSFDPDISLAIGTSSVRHTFKVSTHEALNLFQNRMHNLKSREQSLIDLA
jgi:hypothetical protein